MNNKNQNGLTAKKNENGIIQNENSFFTDRDLPQDFLVMNRKLSVQFVTFCVLIFNVKLTRLNKLFFNDRKRIKTTMSFIDFESGWEKDKARQELREVRAELLKRVKNENIPR